MPLTTVPFLILASLLPAFVWLVLFLREDVHPEPRRLIILAFGTGILVSLPALALQYFFKTVFSVSPAMTLVGLALIEECFKFSAAYWTVSKKPEFDEPVDAMIYMVVAGLGFASVENLFLLAQTYHALVPSTLLASAEILALRTVGATLLHTLASAIVGYYWGIGKWLSPAKRLVGWGIAVATSVHIVFNVLVLKFQETTLLYSSLFLLFVAFFVLNAFERLKKVNP